MLLGDIIVELCDTPIYSYQTGAWVLADVKCRVPPYDRFISDRAFGQKKRLVQTPGGQLLPASNYYRPGRETGRTYMVESVNEDQDGNGEYLNVYMLREAADACEILTLQETPRPSGTPKKEWVVSSRAWVDFAITMMDSFPHLYKKAKEMNAKFDEMQAIIESMKTK